jgi:hypothetical protein
MDILSTLHPDITAFSLSLNELGHNASDIFTVLGYTEDEAPQYLFDFFDEVLEQAAARCRIQGGYRYFSKIEWNENSSQVRFENIVFDVGKIITTQLHSVESAAVLVCTIGAGLETWSRQLLNKGDFFKGYMVDTFASHSVELAAQKIQDYFEKEGAQNGLKISNCYSPGYCGWHVSEQQKLFSLLPDHFCGITLTDSSLMLPIKSISGVIGIGPNVRKMDYTCRLCDMSNCIYRRPFENSG